MRRYFSMVPLTKTDGSHRNVWLVYNMEQVMEILPKIQANDVIMLDEEWVLSDSRGFRG